MDSAPQENGFVFSALEAQIVRTIEHVGWYAHLWFPIVYREVMNFDSKAPDEEVHTAFAGLIRKGALRVTQEKWGAIPDWELAPGALEAATRSLCSQLGPRRTQGYRVHRESARPHFDKVAQQFIDGEHWHLFEVSESPERDYFWHDVWLAGRFPPAPTGAVPTNSINIS
jgi:hypothetical protein